MPATTTSRCNCLSLTELNNRTQTTPRKTTPTPGTASSNRNISQRFACWLPAAPKRGGVVHLPSSPVFRVSQSQPAMRPLVHRPTSSFCRIPFTNPLRMPSQRASLCYLLGVGPHPQGPQLFRCWAYQCTRELYSSFGTSARCLCAKDGDALTLRLFSILRYIQRPTQGLFRPAAKCVR